MDYICKEFFGSGMKGTEGIFADCYTVLINSKRMFKIISIEYEHILLNLEIHFPTILLPCHTSDM